MQMKALAEHPEVARYHKVIGHHVQDLTPNLWTNAYFI